ncbi:MAG TPA: ATP-binding protein [Planctomycetota bacterium]|nr:ATP-binding protein [Planctomycetota bacterium]
MPAVAITGIRQTGKTTLLREEPNLQGRRYVTFDDFAQLEAARQNPEDLLSGDDPLTIDEAQKCPELFTALKREIDRRRRPGRFLLSGSVNLLLLKNMSETLAGRAVYLNLHPFHRREILGQTGSAPFLPSLFKALAPSGAPRESPFSGGAILSSGGPHLQPRLRVDAPPPPIAPHELLKGGMPSVCLGEVEDPSIWFRSFEQTYLERDLRGLSQVADLIAFRRVMQMAALRTGQILKQSELARDAQLNSMTTGRYLDLLETSFVIARLPAYLNNRTSRLIKSPKLLFTDVGIAAHLAGVKDLDPASDEPLRGYLFETFVAQNLAGILSAHWPEARLHFWNVQGRHEVDFVIEDGRDSIALEIKAGTRWGEGDLAPLRTFLASSKRCRAGILVHNGQDAVHLGERLWALPMGLVLS